MQVTIGPAGRARTAHLAGKTNTSKEDIPTELDVVCLRYSMRQNTVILGT